MAVRVKPYCYRITFHPSILPLLYLNSLPGCRWAAAAEERIVLPVMSRLAHLNICMEAKASLSGSDAWAVPW